MNFLIIPGLILLIIGMGLYSQTKYIFSTDWWRYKLDSLPEGRIKHALAIALWFYPFFHGRRWGELDVRYFTISVFTRSWKKYGTGWQWSKPAERGNRPCSYSEGDFHYCSWLGIHILGLVIEFHFSWGHIGDKWYRPGGKDWRDWFPNKTLMQELRQRFKIKHFQ